MNTQRFSLFSDIPTDCDLTLLLIQNFRDICSSTGVTSVEFSVYEYEPLTFAESRNTYLTSLCEFKACIQGALSDLRPNQNIAVHSKVQVDGKAYHIPMIDFSAISLRIVERTIQHLCNDLNYPGMHVYASGRSFHAYGTGLLSPDKFVQFMGYLLLCNSRGVSDVIDSRWIGHRLIGGYAALRLTNQAGHYLAVPQFVTHIRNTSHQIQELVKA